MRRPGRTDCYEVLKDVVRVVDREVQKIAAEQEKMAPDKFLNAAQASAIGTYLRELTKATSLQPGWDKERLAKLSDTELTLLIEAAQKERKERAGVS
jgi:hypothetical protein